MLPRPRRRSWIRRISRWLLLFVAALYAFWIVSLAALRFVDPFTTTVQVQRRIEGVLAPGPYTKRQTQVPLSRISPSLPHAVIAAEDARFYQHSGIDWKQVQLVAGDAMESGEPMRGASTITQQLIKNLFFTTHRNPVRKAVEWTLAPVADAILGKQRTLELYLNTVEWGPGVFGAEAAARYHYGVAAANLDRNRSARLAAILPSPLRRKPAAMNRYAGTILNRMQQMGW